MNTLDDLLQQGMLAHRDGDLDAASQLYQAALHINPYLSSAHDHLGQVLLACGSLDEGIAHLEEAVRYDPDNVRAWDHLARVRMQLKAYASAEYAALRALKLRPANPHLLTRLGTAVAAQQRFTEALQFYHQAIVLERDHYEAWLQMGITLYLRNDLAAARSALQSAISLYADDTTALRHLALVELGLGHQAGAIAQFERLLRLQPQDHDSRLDLAVILLAQQEGEAALHHLDRIAAPQRNGSKFRFYQALALQQTGHPRAGETLLLDLARQHDDYALKAQQVLQRRSA